MKRSRRELFDRFSQSEDRVGAWNIVDKVLVLSEDDTGSGFLGVILQREGFLPILANNRDSTLENVCTLEPDVRIIDVPLAGISCIDLCLQLQMCRIAKPIIVLGDSNEEIDKVLALEAGADYYIVKPFAPRELVARVRALLRRRGSSLDPVIRFGNVEVDRQRQAVTCRGQEVKMTPSEYNLLLFFLRNADLALTRETILSSVWSYSETTNTRTLDAHISKLRSKCEPDPGAQTYCDGTWSRLPVSDVNPCFMLSGHGTLHAKQLRRSVRSIPRRPGICKIGYRLAKVGTSAR
jgi:DNA-binding response OmpR family regulator